MSSIQVPELCKDTKNWKKMIFHIRPQFLGMECCNFRILKYKKKRNSPNKLLFLSLTLWAIQHHIPQIQEWAQSKFVLIKEKNNLVWHNKVCKWLPCFDNKIHRIWIHNRSIFYSENDSNIPYFVTDRNEFIYSNQLSQFFHIY